MVTMHEVSMTGFVEERICPVARALSIAAREGELRHVRSLLGELAIAVEAGRVLAEGLDDLNEP